MLDPIRIQQGIELLKNTIDIDPNSNEAKIAYARIVVSSHRLEGMNTSVKDVLLSVGEIELAENYLEEETP